MKIPLGCSKYTGDGVFKSASENFHEKAMFELRADLAKSNM